MANTKRNLMGAAAATVVLLAGGRATAADNNIKTLVLHVENFAQVSQGVLIDAEKLVNRIYSAAGVRTVWVSGESHTAPDPSVAFLTVVILDREMAEKKIAAEQIDNNVLGRAAAPTKRAYILYHRIAEIAKIQHAIVNDVLGKVMAHEVGHLVLAPGHSDRGIMRAEIDLRPTVRPEFTKNQVATIHGFLAGALNLN
jgi:hypothetical protein